MGRKKKSAAPISSSPGPEKPRDEIRSNEKANQASVSENLNHTVTSRAEIPEICPTTPIAEAVVNDAMQKWYSFTSHSRISDKGMRLKFIAPVLLDGQPIAKLDKAEVSKLSDIWINSIIVYVVGQNPT